MADNNNLSLIGCGWLGTPLARIFQREKYQLTVTTLHDKSKDFAEDGITYICHDLSQCQNAPEEILASDILIYTIPPLKIEVVKHFFNQISSEKKIIFTSSTSVYGKNLGAVSEETPLSLENTSSPLLIETENYLRSRFKNLTIIRLGGLYGYQRHPVFFLQGKKQLANGSEFLHLVHREDCIKGIIAILKRNTWGETINLVSDLRISKRDYYTGIATKLSLIPPEYEGNHKSLKATKISNEKSKNVLGMTYENPNEFCRTSE